MITRLPPARPSGPFAVLEGLAGNGDAVEPRLELGRDAEIVHRRADHDRVRFEELAEHRRVGELVEGQVRDGIGGEVAINHLLTPLRALELLDEGFGELTAGAVVAVDAGIDM